MQAPGFLWYKEIQMVVDVDQIVLGLGIYQGFFSGSFFRGAYFWIGSLHLLEIGLHFKVD